MANINAGADLTGKVGLAVKLDANGKAVVATDDTAIGILRNDGKAGEEVGVAVFGEAKAKLAGTVNAGDQLMATAGGAMQVVTDGKQAIAVALEKGVANDIITVVVDRDQYNPAST